MSKVLWETERFTLSVGVVNAEEDPIPQYLVTNKQTGIVEFCNASLYFARDWMKQFTEALESQDKEIEELVAPKVERRKDVN